MERVGRPAGTQNTRTGTTERLSSAPSSSTSRASVPGDGIDGYARAKVTARATSFTLAPQGYSHAEAATLTTAGKVASWFGAKASWRGARFPVSQADAPPDRHAIVFASATERPSWLANRPPVILADEPTAPLDSERALGVMRILNRMAREARTAIIVVTHDEKIIPTFRRIYHIRDGQTVEEAGEGRALD